MLRRNADPEITESPEVKIEFEKHSFCLYITVNSVCGWKPYQGGRIGAYGFITLLILIDLLSGRMCFRVFVGKRGKKVSGRSLDLSSYTNSHVPSPVFYFGTIALYGKFSGVHEAGSFCFSFHWMLFISACILFCISSFSSLRKEKIMAFFLYFMFGKYSFLCLGDHNFTQACFPPVGAVVLPVIFSPY